MKLRGFLLPIAITIVLPVMQACSRPLPPQESCNFVQNIEQQRVSWAGRMPVKLYLHSSVPQTAWDAIDRAVAEYNAKLGNGKEVFRIVQRNFNGSARARKDGYSVIYWSDTWDPNKPNEQGRTVIYWSGSHIFEADLSINTSDFNYYMAFEGNFPGQVDLTSLMVHELGHVLGLAHTENHGSVMNTQLDYNQSRRELSAQDLANLRCEY